MVCRGEYFSIQEKCSASPGSPNSVIQAWPIVNLWNLPMNHFYHIVLDINNGAQCTLHIVSLPISMRSKYKEAHNRYSVTRIIPTISDISLQFSNAPAPVIMLLSNKVIFNLYISRTPTWHTTALKRSGLWLAHAATSSPPLLPPSIASLSITRDTLPE